MTDKMGAYMKKKWILIIAILLLCIQSACSNNSSEVASKLETKDPQKSKKGEGKTVQMIDPSEFSKDGHLEKVPPQGNFKSPLYKINERSEVVSLNNANEKVVLLTIDDAPDKYGLQMAEILKVHGINAIFFVNGHFIDSAEEKVILKKIFDLGFEIGNHTWNHNNLKKLTEEEQYKEIIDLSNEIEVITGKRPIFFRAPFGSNTDYAKKLAEKEGMVQMNWTYGYDFMKDYMTKESIADIMVNTPLLSNGANLLMHDREWTFQALPDIIKGLKEKGFDFVDPSTIETPSLK